MRACAILLVCLLLAAGGGALAQTTGHAVCYGAGGTMVDCGAPPLLGPGAVFTSGDGLAATSGGNGFSVIDAANTSGAAATLFPNGLNLGTGGSCALSYNGGGCIYAPNTTAINLKFGGNNALEFKSTGQLIDNTGAYSALTLNRLDNTLASGAPVGKIFFVGNDGNGTSETWGAITCDAGVTSGDGADAGVCRVFANSAGISTEFLDFVGATTGAAASVTALQPLILTQPLSVPSAGDGEVQHYQPIDPPSTNLLLQTGNLCLGGPWICINMTSTLNASGMPTSPDGSSDMLLLQTSATSGLTKQSVTISTTTLPYTFSIYWNSTVPMGDTPGTQWEGSIAFGATEYSCIYTISGGYIDVSSGATCSVVPVNDGFGNYRMILTASNTSNSTTAQAKILPNANATAVAYASAYCPQLEQRSTATACMLTGSKPVTRPAGGNPPYTLFLESGTPTETLAPSSRTDIFTGTATSVTLNFPPNPIDGTPKTIACDLALSLTMNPGAGWTIDNPQTSCPAGGAFTYLPDLAKTKWYKVQ